MWYGALTGVVLVLVSVTTYAIHTRAHYDDLDHVIVQATEHVAKEYARSATFEHLTQLLDNPIAPDVVIRGYHADGTPLVAAQEVTGVPDVDPRAVLAHPAGSPIDRVARLAPALVEVNAGRGTFSVVADAQGVRWRVYVLPLANSDNYLVTVAPLARWDTSVVRFRRLVTVLSLAGATTTLLAGLVLAGRALRPVATLTSTAGEIARARDFERRVSVTREHDELGRLAVTFNDMLDTLEHAYQAQQRFVSDASHELRAPLTIVQANLDLIEQHPDLPVAEHHHALREANLETHRLTRLVADLLALARADAGVQLQRRPVELDRVLLDALADARHLARGQQLGVEMIEPVVIQGDPDRLRQLVLILLDNAIKYTPPPGVVTLALRRDGASVELSVRDEGVGIPAADLPHVFERFYRGDPARSRDPGGAGLGLPIARWIAEQHGGQITLDSQPICGTLVIVRLPLAN